MVNVSDNVSSVDTGGMVPDGLPMALTVPFAAINSKYLKRFSCQVLHVHPNSVMFTRKPKSGWVVFHEIEETKKAQ